MFNFFKKIKWISPWFHPISLVLPYIRSRWEKNLILMKVFLFYWFFYWIIHTQQSSDKNKINHKVFYYGRFITHVGLYHHFFWHCRIKHVHHRSMLLDLKSKCVNLHLFNIIFPKSRIIVFIKLIYFADLDNFFQLHSRCAARITFNYKILREIHILQFKKYVYTQKWDCRYDALLNVHANLFSMIILYWFSFLICDIYG